ncbi:MAG: hypothetical protein ABIC91_08905 [Nanoarchaeota archaeon]|nr:hypothetical protein [Nanoarchaeota archaeon]MBU1029815.1 hypothetical protein [Nanoarchaeota archaeon]MBU1849717.1 hypothetical protein [Nanoarchaeota archaeon]
MTTTNQNCLGVIIALEEIASKETTTLKTAELKFLEEQQLIKLMINNTHSAMEKKLEELPVLTSKLDDIQVITESLRKEKKGEENKIIVYLFNKEKQKKEELENERKIRYFQNEIDKTEEQKARINEKIQEISTIKKELNQYKSVGKHYILINNKGIKTLREGQRRIKITENKKTIIRKIDISKYVSKKTNISKEEQENLIQKIREIEEENTTQFEKNLIPILKQKILSTKYNPINIDFLEEIKLDELNTRFLMTWDNKKIPYPKYGVFKVTNRKEDSTFDMKLKLFSSEYSRLVELGVGFSECISNTIKNKLITNIQEYFRTRQTKPKTSEKKIDFKLISKGDSDFFFKEFFCTTYGEAIFEVQNVCILPKTTKEKIETARNDFGEEIYMINEIKSWTEKNIITEPSIIIGLYEEKTYLINNFIPEKIL